MSHPLLLSRISPGFSRLLSLAWSFSGYVWVGSVFALFAVSGSAWAADDAALSEQEQTHLVAWQSLKSQAGVQKATLRITVRGLEPRTGAVRVGLYDEKIAFPAEGHHLEARVVAVQDDKTVLVEFADLPLGVYALAAIYDRNGNGKLDYRLGMFPAEPLAFSAGAKAGMFGPPTFNAAKFELKSDLALVLDPS